MPRWQARVDDLLFEGEAVRESLDVGSSRVVVTSHRVLVFTPDLDGENFRKADRPNVTGVDTGALGKSSFLRRGLSIGVVGLVLLVAGLVFDPSSLFSDDMDVNSGAASEVGFGGIVEMTQSLFSLLLNLDLVLRTLGALALLLATVLPDADAGHQAGRRRRGRPHRTPRPNSGDRLPSRTRNPARPCPVRVARRRAVGRVVTGR